MQLIPETPVNNIEMVARCAKLPHLDRLLEGLLLLDELFRRVVSRGIWPTAGSPVSLH